MYVRKNWTGFPPKKEILGVLYKHHHWPNLEYKPWWAKPVHNGFNKTSYWNIKTKTVNNMCTLVNSTNMTVNPFKNRHYFYFNLKQCHWKYIFP